ncbi:MAG: copper homeostasis periplasmic binding protein CopC [Sphingobium sp.]|jgi:methionine-rich copper-binding protein CopC|nr:copper homeostasis periplasmic binding protein CopC [Sphingobium sp.]
MRFAHSLLAPAALAIAALGLAAPQLANAHTALVSSSPAANATVAAPTKIELRFNEAIIGATARTEIAMTGMPGMGSHAPMPITGFTAQLGKDRKSMTLLLRRPLSAGTYRVTWTAAGADTHRMSGNFSFTVR